MIFNIVFGIWVCMLVINLGSLCGEKDSAAIERLNHNLTISMIALTIMAIVSRVA